MTRSHYGTRQPRDAIHKEGDYTMAELASGKDLRTSRVEEIELSCGGRIIFRMGSHWRLNATQVIHPPDADKPFLERELQKIEEVEGLTYATTRSETIDPREDVIVSYHEEEDADHVTRMKI